jgi:hypothetical protein
VSMWTDAERERAEKAAREAWAELAAKPRWYLESEYAMQSYAEMVAEIEHITGASFHHDSSYALTPGLLSGRLEQLKVLDATYRHVNGFGFREIREAHRVLHRKAHEIGCTFDELRDACFRELERRRAALPPEEEQSEPLDVETSDDEPQSLDVETLAADDNVTPIRPF